MKYLLDVNALVAWHHAAHPHNALFHKWSKGMAPSQLTTCAVTELGLVRVSMQAYGYTREMAEKALHATLKGGVTRLASLPPPALAPWATTAAKTTDAYLCQLAAAHKLQLVTFDAGIKDSVALLIT